MFSLKKKIADTPYSAHLKRKPCNYKQNIAPATWHASTLFYGHHQPQSNMNLYARLVIGVCLLVWNKVELLQNQLIPPPYDPTHDPTP